MLNLKNNTNIMNRITSFFIKYILFTSIISIYGCTNESTEECLMQQPNSFRFSVDGDESFSLDIPSGKIIGINGDKVQVLSNKLVSLHNVPAVKEYFISYPDSLKLDEGYTKFTMPEEQSYNGNYVDISSCPLNTITDNKGLEDVKLNPVLGALKINIPANSDFGSITSVTIESQSDNLKGSLQVVPSTGLIDKIEEGTQQITINGPIDISKDVAIIAAIPPQTFTGKLNVKLFSPKGYGLCTLNLQGKSIEQGKTLNITPDKIDWELATYYYGTANSVIVKPGQKSVTVDCGAYYTQSKFYSYENNIADADRLPLSAKQLWNDVSTDFVKGVTLASNRKSFTVNLDGNPGNAVIAIYDKQDPKDSLAKVLWSFHIWVTDTNEQQLGTNSKGNKYTILDRNLGATSATPKETHSIGLLYQWGRKDPFIGASDYATNNNGKMYNEDGELSFITVKGGETSGTVQYSIENPTNFIMYSRSKSNTSITPYYYAYDWLNYGDNALWGNPEGYNYPKASSLVKSIYDPSPAGYMVAPNDTWFGQSDGTDIANCVFANAIWDNGYTLTSPEGQQWWFPIGGWRGRKNGVLSSADTNGYYWYSSTNDENSANTQHLTLGKDAVKLNSSNSRANSCLIRCVKINNN